MSIRRRLAAEPINRPSKQQLRRKIKSSHTVVGFTGMKPGYIYTVVRAISARVNQNYDGWPADELQKAAHTFVGKPVFVNHENYDPDMARGVVVASRYIENGNDRYIECVQEIDPKPFPKLAHEIKTGGLDSVSMGAEAGFTICSYCGNRATDVDDMCSHVLNHKGERLWRFNRKTGRKEKILVYESCHDLGFFELSYVFDPADETAVASRVISAGKYTKEDFAINDGKKPWERETEPEEPEVFEAQVLKAAGLFSREPKPRLDWTPQEADGQRWYTHPDQMSIEPENGRWTLWSPAGTPLGGSRARMTVGDSPQELMDYHHEQGWSSKVRDPRDLLPKQRARTADACPPGKPTCNPSSNAGGQGLPDPTQATGSPASSSSSSSSPNPASPGSQGTTAPGAPQVSDTHGKLRPETQGVETWINQKYPQFSDIGGYRPPDGFNEHSSGSALDVMMPKDWNTQNNAQFRNDVFKSNPSVDYILNDQTQWNRDGTSSPMEDRGSPTQNHFDHFHVHVGSFTDIVLREAGFEPGNTQRTQRPGTMGTYNKAHAYFDQMGAPGAGREGVLDYGAGLGHSEEFGHTYEPYPREDRPFKPTYTSDKDIPEGGYHRVTNLNVLNVVPPSLRHQIVDGIGRAMAPGGHAIITTRGKADVDATKNKTPIGPDDEPDPGAYYIGDSSKPGDMTYQKGFTPRELHQYVSDRLGPGYAVTPIPTRERIGPAGVHVVRHAGGEKAAMNSFEARVLRAFGETEAPPAVDTLREEGSAPEDDSDDFYQYVESPKELSKPDLSEAGQLDREQDESGMPDEMQGGAPQGQGEDDGQFMTLKIPMPAQQQPAPPEPEPPVMTPPPPPPDAPAGPPAPPPAGAAAPPQQVPQQAFASLQRYFSAYLGIPPGEVTLENRPAVFTSSRKPTKGRITMGRSTLAERGKVASRGRRRHFAEGPLTDGGDVSRNDQGEQEEAFISETPPAEPVEMPADNEPNIPNTENNLVAKMHRQRQALEATVRQIHAEELNEAGGPVAELVDPTVDTGPAGEALTGDDFVAADPNADVVETQPKDASLHAFKQFDSWLAKTTGHRSRDLKEATIKKAATEWCKRSGTHPQVMFPALGIVLRAARKNETLARRRAQQAAKGKGKKPTKGARMRRRAEDEKLEVAAPDDRVDVEAPVEDTTDADAQASQYDLNDFGNNAGDDIADPDLSTDQNWAPGEANKTSKVKTAGGILAMRLAEAMISAGIEPNDPQRRYALAGEFEGMSRGAVLDRIALCERFAQQRAYERKVASGRTRGANRSPVPPGLGRSGSPRVASTRRVAENDPTNDYNLYG